MAVPSNTDDGGFILTMADVKRYAAQYGEPGVTFVMSPRARVLLASVINRSYPAKVQRVLSRACYGVQGVIGAV